MLIICLCIAVALADQASKALVLESIRLGQSVPVIPGLFNLSHVQNTGAAWGMMAGANYWLVLFSFVMIGVFIFLRKAIMHDTFPARIALGIILGGIVGNLADRIRLGYVVDFLDFHWRGSHFPSFNIADSALCVGVAIYLLCHLRSGGQTPPPADPPGGKASAGKA